MHGVVLEIEIKINTPALDFPLIGVLTKHSSRRISVCLAPLNGGYKISSYPNYGTGHQRLAPSLIHQISFDQSDCARKLYFCNKYDSFVILPINIQQIHLFWKKNFKKIVPLKPHPVFTKLHGLETRCSCKTQHPKKWLNWNTFLKLFTLVTKKTLQKINNKQTSKF